MASIKYRPGSVEFYAPDTFERDSLNCCYTTASNAVAAKGNYVLAGSCDGAFTIADSADSTAYGLANVCVSGVDTVTDRIGELEEKIKGLELAIARSKADESVKKMGRMERLRAELKTLCY